MDQVETTHAADEEQARYWNSDEASHWLDHEERYERMLAPYSRHLLAAAAIGEADRIIDVGCGTGSTTRASAKAAPAGEVLGVDLSGPMLRLAARRAREDGLTNVRFEHGDAQAHRFEAEAADVAISRFGVMFFADPAVAFANIARALRPGGRLVFLCWQGFVDNEWIMVPGAAAAQHVALPPLGDPEAPGPFSLGERDRLTTVLGAAGLADVIIEPVTEQLWLGSDVTDTIAFLETTGIGRALLGEADPLTLDRVREALQAALAPYATPDGVRLGSRAWLVTAHEPG